MEYEKDIALLLGPQVYEKMLEAADHGIIDHYKLTDISAKLDPRVNGDLVHAKQSPNFEMGRWALRRVLCKWYNFILDQQGSALLKLISVLRHPDINLLALAAEIEQIALAPNSNIVKAGGETLMTQLKKIPQLESKNIELEEKIARLEDKLEDAEKRNAEKNLALCEMQTRLDLSAEEKQAILGEEEMLLGKGSFGANLYRKKILNTDYTVQKINKRTMSVSASDLDRWQTLEGHPHILPLHGIYNDGPYCCLVTEPIINGGTMESIIREKEVYVTEVNTWRIMAFLSDVLQHLHRHRSGPILARGLSPASLQSVCIPSERGTMAYDFRLSHR